MVDFQLNSKIDLTRKSDIAIVVELKSYFIPVPPPIRDKGNSCGTKREGTNWVKVGQGKIVIPTYVGSMRVFL